MYKNAYLSLSLLICATMLLAACEKPVTENEHISSRLVKTFVIADANGGHFRNFPATVDAHRKADLAFRVPGTVAELPILEGQRVKAGDVLMQLDQTDFKITLNDRQARYSRASKDFKRGKELVGKGHISRTDFDKLEAEFTSSRAALNQAKQDLQYTTLTAPFDGSVAARLVEKFEEVRAKQIVLELRDTQQLDIVFNVPENLVRSLNTNADADGKPQEISDRIKVSVQFAGGGKSYPASFREASTRADPKTQTFKVTYTLPTPDDLHVLPGMTAQVSVDLSQFQANDSSVYNIPLDALSANKKMQSGVWRVNPQTMKVSFQAVETGNMQATSVQILSGLKPGDIIVSAGSSYLSEGMQVRLMAQKEQAENRLMPHANAATTPRS